MRFEFIGKDIDISPAIKEFVEKKFSKLSRYLREFSQDQVDVLFTLSSVRERQRDYGGGSRPTVFRVDVDIKLKTPNGGKLHAYEEGTDVFSAIDKVLDEIERQLRKLKEKRLEQRRKGAKLKRWKS